MDRKRGLQRSRNTPTEGVKEGDIHLKIRPEGKIKEHIKQKNQHLRVHFGEG